MRAIRQSQKGNSYILKYGDAVRTVTETIKERGMTQARKHNFIWILIFTAIVGMVPLAADNGIVNGQSGWEDSIDAILSKIYKTGEP